MIRSVSARIYSVISFSWGRYYHRTVTVFKDDKKEGSLTVSKKPIVKPVSIEFASSYNKLLDSVKERHGLTDREQFYMAIEKYLEREKYRRNHVQFMIAAARRMDEFGLNKDLQAYNRLIDVFPKGKFLPRRMLEAFWPPARPQNELCLEILTKMEENGVRPNQLTYNIIKAIFGKTFVLEKCESMMQLFDKYEDIDPYEIRTKLPKNPIERSRLCLLRMGGEDARLLHVQLSQSKEDEPHFILSGHSEKQWSRLEALKGRDLSRGVFLHVEGPRRIWLKKLPQHYFTLRVMAGEDLLQEIDRHVDGEGLLLGMCMCKPFSEASLQLWIHAMQKRWPSLSNATIIYKVSDPDKQQQQQLPTSEQNDPSEQNLLSS